MRKSKFIRHIYYWLEDRLQHTVWKLQGYEKNQYKKLDSILDEALTDYADEIEGVAL